MKTLICTFCNNSYEKSDFKAKTSKFCSKECFDKKTYQKDLTSDEIQIILTGIFGDGSLSRSSTYHLYHTNSRFLKYIKYKQSFLKNLTFGKSSKIEKNGYAQKPIFQFSTQSHPKITEIAEDTLENNLKKMTDFGIALWFYDDSSLHHKHFYNLCTHAFSKKIQQTLFIPFLQERLGVKATLAQDRKKDGRHFYYLRINKKDGAEKISALLKKYYCPCYKYKIF